jgi:hypothetical protein
MLISAYRRTEAGEPPEPRSERDGGNDEALHDALVSRLAEAMEATDPGEWWHPAAVALHVTILPRGLQQWLPSGSQLCHLNGCPSQLYGQNRRPASCTNKLKTPPSDRLRPRIRASTIPLEQVALPDALSRRRAARPRTQRHVLSGLQRCTLPSLLLLARNRLPTTRSWPCCGLAPRSCGKRCHFPLHQSTNYWFHVGRVHFVHVHEVFSRAPHR